MRTHRKGVSVCRISLAAILLVVVAACSIKTSSESVTEATLRRSTAILEHCSANARSEPLGRVDPAECLSNYADKNGVPLEALTRDAFGQSLVLERSEVCAEAEYCGPYSTGSDRVDNCGKGDDLILPSCKPAW